MSGVRKNVQEQGDIWVVAKTLKAFNRLRVAWEEDYGTMSIPVEPPPARWADCSEADWVRVKGTVQNDHKKRSNVRIESIFNILECSRPKIIVEVIYDIVCQVFSNIEPCQSC